MSGSAVLHGRPIVYDAPTLIRTPVGNFREIIAAGALTELLTAGTDTTLVRDHDPGRLLGRTTAGTLTLTDGPAGLDVRSTLPPTALGEETAVLVERRDLNGMSFAFTVTAERWHEPASRGGEPTRVVTRIGRLFDVSVVTWPAYGQTTVRVRRDAAPVASSERARDLVREHLAVQTRLGACSAGISRVETLARQHQRMQTRNLGPQYRSLPQVALWCREHRRVVRRCECLTCQPIERTA